MILEFIKHDYNAIFLRLIIISGLWGVVLIAMMTDFYFGVMKAKKMGEVRTSEGYKRSVDKFTQYYGMLFFALLFDAIIPVSYFFAFPMSGVPIITLISTVILVFTEAKSVREKGDEKLRRKTDQSFKQLLDILEKNGDLTAKLHDYMINQAIKEKDKESPNLGAE